MPTFAELTKKQHDRTLRQMQLDTNKGGVIINEDATGAGSVSNPASDLATHKASGDHDSRYYTETELNAGQLDTLYPRFYRQEFNAVTEVVVAHNIGDYPIIQVVGSVATNYGAGNYGDGDYGGISTYQALTPDSIVHDNVNQATVTLDAVSDGEVICIG